MNKDNYAGFMTHTIDNNQTELYEERNAINQTSIFTTTDGATKSINDVWFMINNMDTAHDTTITLKEVDNIKKCFYLFSNDIWHIDIKNRNLLSEVA